MDPPLLSPRLPRLSTTLCTSCLHKARAGLLPRPPWPSIHQTRLRHSTTNIAPAGHQANPLEGYYADLLSQPLSRAAPAIRTPARSSDPPKTDREAALEKARIVFGSRLAGPAERRAELERKSVNVAGIMVPPRPEEPDNCCMSGCVNCVWDRYRDELEEWAEKSAAARERVLRLQRGKKQREGLGKGGVHGMGLVDAKTGTPVHVVTSMDDDDGGGSEGNWSAAAVGGGLDLGGGKGDLFGDIPVGIREFMKMEKMLKERHRKEAAGMTKMKA